MNAKMPRYEACSGQSKGLRHWSVWSPDLEPWWRPLDRRGRVRLFASVKAAQKLAVSLSRAARKAGRP